MGPLFKKKASKAYFENKVSFVTGGASGIGKAICLELGKQGATVVVADKNFSGAMKTRDEILANGQTASAVELDVSREENVRAVLRSSREEYGRIDLMFNVAGISLVSEIRDMNSGHWQKVIDVNMMGTLYGSKEAFDLMLEQGHGHICNVSSAAGLITQPTTSIYTMTKHAIVGFTKCLIAEARALGIDVTLVCPGYVKSNIYQECELVNVQRRETVAQVPFKMMDTEQAATSILKAVRKRKNFVVFPLHAKIFWLLSRLSPALSLSIAEFALKDFRKIRRSYLRDNKA